MELADYRSSLDSFFEAVYREQYLVGSGRKSARELASIFSDYSDLFSREAIGEIDREIEKVPAFLESQRKSLLKLHTFAIEHHLEFGVIPLDDEIAAYERRHSVAWDEETVRVGDIERRLADERDASRR